MIEITEKPISPELVANKAKTDGSGCVATYSSNQYLLTKRKLIRTAALGLRAGNPRGANVTLPGSYLLREIIKSDKSINA